MRLLIYGTLILLSAIILIDTNSGEPVSPKQRIMVLQAVQYMREKHLYADAELVESVERSGGLRKSKFFDFLAEQSVENKGDFDFHAYAPVLSRNRIFLGADFDILGPAGRASVLVHEAEHLRRHRARFLRGFPRGADESDAYLYQYSTYRKLHLTPLAPDSLVYWDMMIGIQDYVIPRHPKYAERPDIRESLQALAGT